MRQLLWVLVLGVFFVGTAQAAEPIKIGGIFSLTALPSEMGSARDGVELAVKEFNEAGGLNGRMAELLVRDDKGEPGDAVRVAEELIFRDNVSAIVATTFSHASLALSETSRRHKMPYFGAFGSVNELTWEKGHKYTFIIEPPPVAATAILAEEAAKLPAKRWAILAPDYAYGRSFSASFREHLKKMRPDVEFVSEHWAPFGKLDAGPTVQALNREKPDAIINLLFGSDLVKYLRAARTRGVLQDVPQFSPTLGFPLEADFMGDELPMGWIVMGYPWQGINTPEHKAFVEKFTKTYEVSFPTLYGLMGYFVGRMEKDQDGNGMMMDWRWPNIEEYMPSDEWIRSVRPQEEK
ncbi:MAG: ABC transporter substrate-binding protein [Alphaproteobacteria bacterium]|nr:ABC transporter substrate-binding protein [Alphaproteobacteria bacterium]